MGRGSNIPARPVFPFAASGAMTPLARQKIESAARTEIAKALKG